MISLGDKLRRRRRLYAILDEKLKAQRVEWQGRQANALSRDDIVAALDQVDRELGLDPFRDSPETVREELERWAQRHGLECEVLHIERESESGS